MVETWSADRTFGGGFGDHTLDYRCLGAVFGDYRLHYQFFIGFERHLVDHSLDQGLAGAGPADHSLHYRLGRGRGGQGLRDQGAGDHQTTSV